MDKQNSEIRFRASLASNGDPWPVITRSRLGFLSRLQDGTPIDRIGWQSDDSDGESLEAALAELESYSLLEQTELGPRPTFLIASHEETRRVVEAASATGDRLAACIAQRWDFLRSGFDQMSTPKGRTFEEASFFLVGARMLDIDLLSRLARDGRLLIAAPSRPSPSEPNAKYFFYAIEGEVADMGAYGLDWSALSWSEWQIGTFARNIVCGAQNPAREQLDRESARVLQAGTCESPQALAASLNAICLDREAMLTWEDLESELLEQLHDIYRDEHEAIRTLSGIGRLRPEQALGEFACWYHHVAFAAAVESLISAGLIAPPEGECILAIWYRTHPQEGLLIDA